MQNELISISLSNEAQYWSTSSDYEQLQRRYDNRITFEDVGLTKQQRSAINIIQGASYALALQFVANNMMHETLSLTKAYLALKQLKNL